LLLDESIGAEVDANTLNGSSASTEVVLDALTVGSEDKPISGACLLLTHKNDYDTSNIGEINNIYEVLIKDNMENYLVIYSIYLCVSAINICGN